MQGELDLRRRTWGGARAGAGRKRDPMRREPAHRARPQHVARNPVHVVLRVRREVGRLRRGPVYAAVRVAMMRMLARSTEFRVVHVSIQHNHLHLLVEAATNHALSEGMRALTINLAKAINRSLGRTGKVFAFRYHATTITTPRQSRSALAYVLNNWRQHREDTRTAAAASARVDPYSTAIAFDGWKEHARFVRPARYTPLPRASPETWLLRIGWQRHGLISVREIPGPLAERGALSRARHI